MMDKRIMADSVLSRIIDVIVGSLDPDAIILFGSRARGNAREDSDFDICILKKNISDQRKIARSLYRALYSVGVPVELIVETPDSFNKFKDNPHLIYREIARYGKVVYEKPHSG
jgi:predicted nucleotidyltransferase